MPECLRVCEDDASECASSSLWVDIALGLPGQMNVLASVGWEAAQLHEFHSQPTPCNAHLHMRMGECMRCGNPKCMPRRTRPTPRKVETELTQSRRPIAASSVASS
eukprot:6175510-Pleurochrysis_carterae.AAC.2